jgi:TPR repeat protein
VGAIVNVVKVARRNDCPVALRSVARSTQAGKKWMRVCVALLFAMCSVPCYAQDVDQAVEIEPPQVLALLNEAITLERSAEEPYKIRRAITLYCRAARFGSLEAMFRFGTHYFSGSGVPKNLDFASALFSQAAQQGHHQAMNMLENVKLRNLELPACML